MTRGILIAGNESSLYAAAAAEAVKRVESFAAACIPNRFPLPEGSGIPPKTEMAAGAVYLPWNPASPISARTLILAVENRLEKINDAILICTPPAVFKKAEALAPEEIEILVNDHIKGWFFLIRELAIYFRRTGSGSLSLVVPEAGGDKDTLGQALGVTRGVAQGLFKDSAGGAKGAPGTNPWGKNAQTDLLGSSAAALFRSLAQGILNSSANEPFHVMGFTGSEAGVEAEFAAWLFKIIDEASAKSIGRWHKFSGRRFFR